MIIYIVFLKYLNNHSFDTEGEGGGKYIAAYVVSDAPVDVEALHDFAKYRE